MKRFLKKSILFIPLLFVVYLFVLFILAITPLKNFIPTIKSNTGGPGQSLLRFREAQQVNHVDLLFIGSSHTSKGFDNRLFAAKNISSFNLGSGLQTPQNSYFLLKEYGTSIAPKKIIMELFWDVLAYENGTEACIDLTSNCPPSMEIVKMNLSTKEFKVINSMIVGYMSRIVTPLKDIEQKTIHGETYVPGGYLEGRHNDDYTRTSISAIKSHTIALQKKQLEYIKRISLYCQSQHIPLLFVTAPVPQELLTSISNYEEVINTIKTTIASSKNEWINFNDENYRKILRLNSVTDFDDANHLSQQGVKKFNTLLLNLIPSHYK